MNLEWMAWTPLTACFFTFIVIMLIGMTIWQQISPTVERKGFLPMATTRGDRLFISLLGSAYIYIAWILFSEANLWLALPICIVYLIIIMRFG